MNLNNLLAQTEKFMVNDSKGFGVDVVYIQVPHHENGLPYRALMSNSDIRGSKSKYAQNETIFYAMELDFEPQENDEIVYRDETYIVKPHLKTTATNGMYDVVTLSHQALKHTRQSRR